MTTKNTFKYSDIATFKYSEIFHSFQGEASYCGRSTAWIRLFACNLTCSGFGQPKPTDPSTYIEPYKTIDLSSITRVEDLPVFEYGCDSSYTWSARFKHLMHDDDAFTICDKIQDVLKHPSNPEGLFLHPATRQHHHMAFTGGEPMLPRNQKAIVAILNEFKARGNFPTYVTVETNGTQDVHSTLEMVITREFDGPKEWFWSISPKLWSTSGEKPEKAIQPHVVGLYADISDHGHLKYVVNGSQQSWDEVERYTEMFRQEGVFWDVYIMPVGATKEEQEYDVIADIAMEAMKRGYHFSGRLHVYTFGNAIGT